MANTSIDMEQKNKKLRIAVVGCGSIGLRSGKQQAALLRAIELAKEYGHEVIHVVEGGELVGRSIDAVFIDDCKELPSGEITITKRKPPVKILHNPKQNGVDRWTKRFHNKSKW